jgi:hypothetical protein
VIFWQKQRQSCLKFLTLRLILKQNLFAQLKFLAIELMSHSKPTKNSTDELPLDFPDDATINSRTTTRLIYTNITATINSKELGAFSKTTPVEVLDISSKGVLIASLNKLTLNKKVTLTLHFKTGKLFTIKAVIVRRTGAKNHEYGLKFERYENELGDYLFESQDNLTFK